MLRDLNRRFFLQKLALLLKKIDDSEPDSQ